MPGYPQEIERIKNILDIQLIGALPVCIINSKKYFRASFLRKAGSDHKRQHIAQVQEATRRWRDSRLFKNQVIVQLAKSRNRHVQLQINKPVAN